MIFKSLFILFFVSVIVMNLNAQGKRGLAYGYHSEYDVEALMPEVSWWYNWSETPESSIATVFSSFDYEFVPMAWNGSYNESKLREFLTAHPETKYLLAFNEPNFLAQANMIPSQVAVEWPKLEAIADEFNLEIVSPALNYCGECVEEDGVTYYDPFEYFDDFFEACPDCRVDHIAIHTYMNTVGAMSWFVDEFKRYGKPIWLTEFSGWESNGNISSVQDQINFMIGAVDFLESNPDVFRYAWFIGRGSGIDSYPHIDILGDDGELTELGEIYKNMPTHNPNHVVNIPALIEAEAYNTMEGILLEQTADESGFANVGYIDKNDWLAYKIKVPSSGDYLVKFRTAGTGNGKIDVLIDEDVVLAQELTSTGGWQKWQTFENSIALTEGEHSIKLLAQAGGFNINWFTIGDETTSIDNKQNQAFNIYPNPASEILTVELSTEDKGELLIFDAAGKVVKTTSVQNGAIIDVSELNSGLYLVKFISVKSILTQRLIIEN